MPKYQLSYKGKFIKKLKKLLKKNATYKKQINKTLQFLQKNPFYKGLKTHKVINSQGKEHYLSRVNDDIRIIWDFHQGQINILEILDIGGHSGKDGVY